MSVAGLLLSAGCLIGMLAIPAVCASDPNATYASFQTMTPAELALVQVKLTYIGPSDELVRSVLFAQDGTRTGVDVFQPFYRYSLGYAGDRIAGVQTFTTSGAEIRAVIDSVAQCPSVTPGLVADRALIAFALYSPQSDGRVFEAAVNDTQAVCLFRALRGALANNDRGLSLVNAISCAAGNSGTTVPTEVTGGLTIVLSGFRLDDSTGRFVTEATVRNDSLATVPGPLALVFEYLTEGSHVFGETGVTCALAPYGREYVVLRPPGGSLATKAIMRVKLEFENPDLLKLHPRIRIFAGPGSY